MTHAAVLPDFAIIADHDFTDLLLTHDFSAAAVIGDLDTEIRLLMKYRRPDLIVTAGTWPRSTRNARQARDCVQDRRQPDCPLLTVLAVQVKANAPVHPGNRPQMIAIR